MAKDAKLTWHKGKYPHKYTVTVDKQDGSKPKNVSFGNVDYEQYKDSSPLKLYKNKDHGDPKRRDAYRKRHAGIIKKDGTRAIDKKYSPAWFSYHYLW